MDVALQANPFLSQDFLIPAFKHLNDQQVNVVAVDAPNRVNPNGPRGLPEGEGLHFPVVARHFVENAPEVSVSFSITFQAKDSADRQTLHRLNKKLRRVGLTPSNVGRSAWRDNSKPC